MAKENSQNTWNLKNNGNDKHESSDSDDFDERPSEVFRKVLSENLISPTSTPTRGQSSAARESPSPKTNHAATGQQQQSTFSSAEDQTFNAACSHEPQSTFSSSADQTYANSQTVESIAEQIGDGSTIDSRTLGRCSSKEETWTKEMKIFDTTEPPANTAVKVFAPTNTSDPNNSPLISLSCIEHEGEISLNTEQNYQTVGFPANVSLVSGSSSTQVSSSESEDSLMTCSAEENASTKRSKITEISEPSSSTEVEMIVPNNASDPKDPPLVFVSSTGYEEEIFSSPEQNNQLGSLAADVLLSDSSSKEVPTSAESEDSDDVGMFEERNEPFTTPEALEEEIRSVFEMISSYVNTEINKTRTKRRTLELNLSRRRAFVRHHLSQTLEQFSAVSRRIASELLSTLTEQEGLEFTYQGPSRINDQLPLLCFFQESAQYFGHESYGISSQGSYGSCCQQSFASQEPTEQLVQASGRSAQESFELDSSSSERLAQLSVDLTSQGLASSSSRRLTQDPSEGLTLSSPAGLAAASSMEGANSDLSRTSKELNELPRICRLFARGYSIGLRIGSENYAQRVPSGSPLQSRFGQMIEDLEQHLQVQTQGIPQELIDLASRMMFLICPQTTHVVNTLVPRNEFPVYFVGLFVGFSFAYSQWSSRRQIFSVSSRIAPRLLHRLSPDLQRSLREYLTGLQQGIPPRSSMGFSDTPHTISPDHALSLLRAEANRPSSSVRAHESSSSSSSTPRYTRPSEQEGPSNIQGRIHVLLTQLVVDLNMIRSLADLISREYRSRDFERISSYLLCFEIMREDYREKESRYIALEREISKNVRRHRREAFAILHMEILMDILEHCISRIQYGALLVRTHERLGEVITISNSIRRVTRSAMSYLFWTKEN
ncbi:hypothetical protein JTE90_027861 [Oedothorax gibbosus]|uniref:Uncharacterized protein n=1 Tax=Oedothorax gibbosus TaxID=931172 RepID=A0AAV6U811_9ARAC|nr:hypothetical protein JTE90_027861 [Oedothorax gibbosus]